MKVDYEITPDDLFTFYKEAVKGSSYYNEQVAIFTIIGLVFMVSDLIVLIFVVYLNDGSVQIGDFTVTILIKGIVWIVLMCIVWLVLTSFSKREVRKSGIAPGINGVYCKHSLEIDDLGFTEITKVNKSFNNWEGVESIRETESLVLITIRLGPIYFIPKREFEDDAQRLFFLETVEEHINKANLPSS